MYQSLLVLLAFTTSLLTSPWKGSFFLTLILIVAYEVVYALIWPWSVGRVWIIAAALAGWGLGRIFLNPLIERTGHKAWVEDNIEAVKKKLLG